MEGEKEISVKVGFLQAVIPGPVWKDSSEFICQSAVGREGTKTGTNMHGWSAVFLGHDEGKKWDQESQPGHKESKGQLYEINEQVWMTSHFLLRGFFSLWQEHIWSKAFLWHLVLRCGFIGRDKIKGFFFSSIILAAVSFSHKAKFILFH